MGNNQTQKVLISAAISIGVITVGGIGAYAGNLFGFKDTINAKFNGAQSGKDVVSTQKESLSKNEDNAKKDNDSNANKTTTNSNTDSKILFDVTSVDNLVYGNDIENTTLHNGTRYEICDKDGEFIGYYGSQVDGEGGVTFYNGNFYYYDGIRAGELYEEYEEKLKDANIDIYLNIVCDTYYDEVHIELMDKPAEYVNMVNDIIYMVSEGKIYTCNTKDNKINELKELKDYNVDMLYALQDEYLMFLSNGNVYQYSISNKKICEFKKGDIKGFIPTEFGTIYWKDGKNGGFDIYGEDELWFSGAKNCASEELDNSGIKIYKKGYTSGKKELSWHDLKEEYKSVVIEDAFKNFSEDLIKSGY